jgi:hypothetical protein
MPAHTAPALVHRAQRLRRRSPTAADDRGIERLGRHLV